MNEVARAQRVAALRQNVLPELKSHPHWTLHDDEKRPRQRNGSLGSSTAPATWCSFNEAVDAFERGVGEGVGVVLTSGDNLVAIDLDHCVIDGDVQPWTNEQRKAGRWEENMPDPRLIIERAGTYAEYSRSGTGVHVFGYGRLPAKGRKCGDFEIYDQGRFIVVTGKKVGAQS